MADGSVDAVIARADDVPQCYVDNDWLCAPYWSDYRPELVDATVEHLWITVVSVLVGFVIAVPLALLARRNPAIESMMVGEEHTARTARSNEMRSFG